MTANPFVTGSVVISILFALLYFPALKASLVLVSPYPKASLGKRFFAAAIDGLLVASFVAAPWNAGTPVLAAAGLLYLLLRDAFGGQSIGKQFAGLVVVHVDSGARCGLAGSLKRNVVLAIPGAHLVAALLETRTLVQDPQGQRLGDRVARTQVVEGLGARDLVADLQAWWADFLAQLPEGARPDRGRRRPVRVPNRRTGQGPAGPALDQCTAFSVRSASRPACASKV